ncbi:hypothetical protein CBLAS_0970 [Campylobacter blaseri]|uniref:Protein hydE n=1 Tax=Campylobacter blaseri TaxID=2042961 RepID=A0A2P8QYU0_9BACT|nr:hypothetical protein [Campylobacter blaseri]PSM51402.1 hypothetical protein CQ405_08415 [Campylobacter blaseri]PSM52852.1 hypothetical protein CRN67_08420 [Campylobacter blaseri]QKF86155.1 hypothetical protein CBLAS_0970 [Campylobacter blaseri]
MIISYEFKYLNKNNFLIFFLEYYAKKSNLNYSIISNNSTIKLFVEGDEEEQVKFSDEYMALIPNSIFLAKSSVENVDELPKSDYEYNKSSFANITPKVVKEYLNDNNIENEYGVFSEISVLKNGEFIEVRKDTYNDLLNFTYLAMTHNQTLTLKDRNFTFEIKSDYDFANADFLMPTTFKAIPKVFSMDEKNLIALASLEKPILNQRLNSIFRDKHPNSPLFFNIKAASDFFLFSMLDNLYRENIFFVSVIVKNKSFKPFKVSTLDNSFLVINQGEFISQKERSFLEKNSDSEFSLYGLICNELDILDDRNVNIFLSKTKDDSIKIHDNSKSIDLLNFKKYSSYEDILEEIVADETGSRLYENFSKEFIFPKGKIEKSNNFYSLFDIISNILFQKNADYLLLSAKAFFGKKGVRVDYLLKEKKQFDISRFIRSGMSYKLAGIDDKLLSYGYIESLIHFLDDLLGDIKDEIDFKNTILTGSLFEEIPISNLALKIITKDKNPKFSNYFGLEGF